MRIDDKSHAACPNIDVTTGDLTVILGLITLEDVRTILDAGFSPDEVEYMLDLLDGQVARLAPKLAA